MSADDSYFDEWLDDEEFHEPCAKSIGFRLTNKATGKSIFSWFGSTDDVFEFFELKLVTEEGRKDSDIPRLLLRVARLKMQARRDGLSEPLRSKLSALSLDAVVSWWGRPADLLISDDPFNLQILGQFLVNENQTRQLCVNLDRLAQFAYDTFFCVPVCSAELEASRAIQEGTPQ